MKDWIVKVEKERQLDSIDHEKQEIQKGLMDTILIEREMKMNQFIKEDL